jgi:hypothetical protein
VQLIGAARASCFSRRSLTRSEPDQAGPGLRAWSRRTMRQAFLLPDTLQREAIVF